MTKQNRWIIGLDGYIDTPSNKLTGFSDNVEEVIVISPYDSSYVMSFGVGNEHRTVVTQYLSVSSDVVSDYVEIDETFESLTYQDIADWTVRRIALKAPTKAYVSRFRGGSVYFSFRVGTIGLNAKTITYKGTFGADNVLPTTGQTTGDYYTCEDIHYTQTVDTKNDVALVFGYGMHTYWGSGGYWVKVSENMVSNTPSQQQAVDPSFAVSDEVDEDEINYLLSFESTLYDHEARLDQAELDIVALEQKDSDILDGTQEFTKVTLSDGLGNTEDITYASKVALDDEVARLETDKADITYSDAQDLILQNQITSNDTDISNLVTANMIKTITRTGTDLITITYYDDTEDTVITLAQLKTFIGEASTSLSGLLSATDKTRLDGLYAILNDTTDGGADSLVDTIEDVLAIFNAYPEGADLVTVLAGKEDVANKKTVINDSETEYPNSKAVFNYAFNKELLTFMLPNFIDDYIKFENGKYYYVQRVKKYTLQASDITTLETTPTEYDYVLVNKPLDSKMYNTTDGSIADNTALIVGFIEKENTNSSDFHYAFDLAIFANTLIIGFPNATYADLAETKADLAGTVIYYQLATPIETEITDIKTANWLYNLFTQEAWITPTLTTATTTYLKYRKDTLGTVIIEGNLTVTTSGTNFTLPTGYRPLFAYVQGDLTFNTDGTVVSASTGLKYINVRFTGGA